MSQSQLGKRMGDLLGREWPRQAVSAAERGERSFTAAELVALAFSLQTSVSGLMTPRADVSEVQLGAGSALPRDIVVSSVLPRVAGMTMHRTFDEMQETVQRAAQDLMNASRALDPLVQDVRLLQEQLIQAMEITSLEGQAAAEGGADER